MDEITKMLAERVDWLRTLEEKAEEELAKAPPGRLRISKGRNQKDWYYHRRETTDRSGVYIPQDNEELVSRLAGKDYRERLIKAIRREKKAIERCLAEYPKISAEQIYERLPERRRKLFTPLIETDDMFAERWENMEYKGKSISGDSPELITQRGEQVRSKSEVIIANMLLKEGIPYRYEYPVRLWGYGTVYPDFTVLNIRKRKEMFWDHFGMMDDPDYASKAVKKLISYNKNKIFPGDRLIITSETRTEPLNIRQIRDVIQFYLK